MSGLQDLRRLLSDKTPQYTTGTVQGVSAEGRVSVATGGRVLTCTTAIPLRQGDTVRLQGLVVVSRHSRDAGALPEYRV